MNNTKTKISDAKTENKTFIHIALFLYWAVLVLWQNIGEYTARSSMDTVLKAGLLVWLTLSYFFNTPRTKVSVSHIFWFSIFVITQLFAFFSESNTNVSIIVSYVFPSLFLFLSFIYGQSCKIEKRQYITFLNCVIAVVAYAAIYAFIFKRDQFLSAFSISSAYGNELSSFFISNHEYGMYLLGGIIACIICLELKKDLPFSKKFLYPLSILLFVPNLFLTFSRTSLLALAVFLLIYIFFRGKSKTRKVLVFSILVIVAVFFLSPSLRSFFFKIVLKENTTAGRDSLLRTAIRYFNDGTLWQQFLGRGIINSRNLFESDLSRGSVHNGYLQVLLYYGITGLSFMVCFLISRFIAAIKLIKKDKFVGVISIGLTATCAALMFTNTSILFTSPIDSFFLTAFTIIIPKYLQNGLPENKNLENEETR